MSRLSLVVLKKELRDMSRDRRAVLAILYYALGVPMLMAFIIFLMSDSRDEDQATRLMITRADLAPALVAFLTKSGIEVSEGVVDGQPTALPENIDAMLVLPDSFAKDLTAGRMTKLHLYVDETTPGSSKRGGTVERALNGYGQQVAGVRLITRGVPVALMAPVAVVTSDLAVSSFGKKMISNSLVLLFMFAPFVAGMSVALDALAGERERHSLQSLMAQPVSVRDLVIGKWLTVAAFSLIGSLLTLTVDLILLQFVPADALPFSVQLTAGGLLVAILQFGTLSLFVSALLLTVSIHAKSFKEGQTYMSLVMMIPVLVGYMKMYGDSKIPAFANYFPILSDVESLGRIFFDGQVVVAYTGAAMLSSLIAAAALLSLTVRRLTSEELLADH